MKNTLVLILILVLIGMNACRSNKRATAVDSPEDVIREACYSIESFSVPVGRLEITFGGQSFALNGSIYIRPDSIFYFRGRMLIDVVRGAIYRDSFVVINTLERICYRGKNEYLQNITGFPVNPESLMMLFTADQCEANIALHSNRQQISVIYDDYNQYGQFALPTVLDISASDGINRIRVKANFQQIMLNRQEQVNISIPANYRIIDL